MFGRGIWFMSKYVSHDKWKCTLHKDTIDVLYSGVPQGFYLLLQSPYCERCSSQGKSTGDCDWHARFDPSLKRVYAVGTYFEGGNSLVNGDILSTHIWRLKFWSSDYAKPLGIGMAMVAKSLYSNLTHCDMIVPVPPFERSESYDHADELATVVAGLLGIPMKRLLSKTREEKMVKKASVEERWKASESLYVMVGRESESGNKTILLVDDICTSGATLSGCSRALSSQGKAREVYALVAGRRYDERYPIK